MGVNLQAVDKLQRNAAHYAALSGSDSIISFLWAQGLDINLEDINGYPPFLYAIQTCSKDTINLFLLNGSKTSYEGLNISLIMMASIGIDPDNIDILFEYDQRINEQFMQTWPILEATKRGNFLIVKKLVEKGADFNVISSNGNSLLHVASELGFLDIVKYLLQLGMGIDLMNVSNETPLFKAIYSKHNDVVIFLLLNGANKALLVDPIVPLLIRTKNFQLFDSISFDKLDLNTLDRITY